MRKIVCLLMPIFLLLLSFRPQSFFTVSGKITDESGKPLSSVSITQKNTSAVSADDGSFSITVTDKNGVLVFSYVGYQQKEVKIKGRAVINVTLQPAAQSLQEVVVVGYGVQHKQDIAGSTVSVRGNDLNVSTNITGNGYYNQEFNTESYDHINENGFKRATDDPLSTFSIDVDAASYSNVRRFLNNGKLPPAGAVRVEEMINYFRYKYDAPKAGDPFSVSTEIADCPWNTRHKLVLVGMQGRQLPIENLPSSNFVFLIDVSGSMQDVNRLPLVKSSLKLLVDQLREKDKVALVVYAGAAGLVLPSTSAENKMKIKDAIDQLSAGGSTAGGEGIRLAYKVAKENFITGGNNRVILCTDGDFNVGVTSNDELERMIEGERKSGVFLTVLGYGMGNYKDSKMQKLADKGNGNHAYIDGLSEAKKVLVNEFGGTMFTIAKDVKLQVEFNPAKVQGYRLVGYENRLLNKEDFNDDKKDAGELGSGHSVTALYEIIPVGVKNEFLKTVDDLKYQKNKSAKARASAGEEIMNIKLRYKAPDSDESRLMEHPVLDRHISIKNTSDNFRFAAAVAQFGMLLGSSGFKQHASYQSVLQLAAGARGNDEEGYRKEFIALVKKAVEISEGEENPDLASVEVD